MTANEFYEKREAELIGCINQLQEQYDWANQQGLFDLRDAYSTGQRLVMDRLHQVQKMHSAIN